MQDDQSVIHLSPRSTVVCGEKHSFSRDACKQVRAINGESVDRKIGQAGIDACPA